MVGTLKQEIMQKGQGDFILDLIPVQEFRNLTQKRGDMDIVFIREIDTRNNISYS